MTLDSGWIDGVLAVACVAVAAGYVIAAIAALAPRPVALAHVVMGVAMAAMFAPGLDPVPAVAWIVAFALIGAWFAAVAIRVGPRAGESGHHVAGAVAMIFMVVLHSGHSAAADGTTLAHHGGGAATDGGPLTLLSTAVALILAAYFATHAVGHLLGRNALNRGALNRDGVEPVRRDRSDRDRAGEDGGSEHGADRNRTAVAPPVATAVATHTRPELRRYVEPAGHVVMGVAMAYMLLGMA